MSQIVLKKGGSISETLTYASPLYINGNTQLKIEILNQRNRNIHILMDTHTLTYIT